MAIGFTAPMITNLNAYTYPPPCYVQDLGKAEEEFLVGS